MYKNIHKPVNYDEKKLHELGKKFLESINSCDLAGFGGDEVTYYIHALVYHVPKQVFKFDEIGLSTFTGEYVEKNNSDLKNIYFKKTNKNKSFKDIMIVHRRTKLSKIRINIYELLKSQPDFETSFST